MRACDSCPVAGYGCAPCPVDKGSDGYAAKVAIMRGAFEDRLAEGAMRDHNRRILGGLADREEVVAIERVDGGLVAYLPGHCDGRLRASVFDSTDCGAEIGTDEEIRAAASVLCEAYGWTWREIAEALLDEGETIASVAEVEGREGGDPATGRTIYGEAGQAAG